MVNSRDALIKHSNIMQEFCLPRINKTVTIVVCFNEWVVSSPGRGSSAEYFKGSLQTIYEIFYFFEMFWPKPQEKS
jgi:hypothetical protein